MRLSYKIFEFTVLLASLVRVHASTPNPETSSQCLTKHSTKSVNPVPTSSKQYTITLPYYGVQTVTPVKTVTPSASTTTSTLTHTVVNTITLPQVTDTFSSTSTFTEISTITLSTSTITAVTSTTSISSSLIIGTTTISTSSGFIPAISTLPGAAAKKREEANLRSANLLRSGSRSLKSQLTGNTCPSIQDFKNNKLPKSYPSSVTCNVVITVFKPIISTVTARKTLTTTAPTSTSTVLTTIITTSLSTVSPVEAITTLLFSTTTTLLNTASPSTTVTSTATTVQTISSYVGTYYAACAAPTNIVGSVGSDGIDSIGGFNSATDWVNSQDTNAYDCCVSCQKIPYCEATSFYGAFAFGSQCYLALNLDATCSEGEYLGIVGITNEISAGGGYLVSNGDCAFYTSSVMS